MKYVVMCNRCLQDWNQLKIFNFPFLKNFLQSPLYHDCSVESIVEESLKFLSKLIFFLRNWRKCRHNESKYTAALCPLLELQCCLPYVVHSSNPQCESQLRHITVINCYCVTTLFQINMDGKKNNLDFRLQSILTSHVPFKGSVWVGKRSDWLKSYSYAGCSAAIGPGPGYLAWLAWLWLEDISGHSVKVWLDGDKMV